MALKMARRRKCKTCKEWFPPTRQIQPCCDNSECQIAFAIAHSDKERKKNIARIKKQKAERERAFSRETKRRKVAMKSKADWLKEAQAAFNRYIRLRDADKPCVSCGRANAVKWDAGHYRSVGASAHLRFNEDNCHKQCARPCNSDLSGNLIEYRKGIIQRIGTSRVEGLEHDNSVVRFSVDELKSIKQKYKKAAEELEVG